MLTSLPVPGIASMTRGQKPHSGTRSSRRRDTPMYYSPSTSHVRCSVLHLLVSKETHGSPPTLMSLDQWHVTWSHYMKQWACPLAICFTTRVQPTTGWIMTTHSSGDSMAASNQLRPGFRTPLQTKREQQREWPSWSALFQEIPPSP